jgi:hypothetical protein
MTDTRPCLKVYDEEKIIGFSEYMKAKEAKNEAV